MTREKPKIIKDQLRFFNENAALEKPDLVAPFFLEYVNKEQTAGFAWLGDREHILDYGCGTGTSIDAFFSTNPSGKNLFVGVDIADVAIQRIKQRYPNFSFYTIENNRIPQLPNGSMDGAYLLHVLHHSHEHEAIFREIYTKLRPGGKFFLSDLSSDNPIIRLFRGLYVLSPRFVTRRFSDDLVVDGAIPEKYKVDPGAVVAQLEAVGFSVKEVSYGHLFLFFFSWFDRFVPLSRFAVFRALYSALWAVEGWLLKFRFFQKNSEVFCVKCIK
ncbi:MAG: class I SAM-dependent methyltransferase [Burkholderiales bacterium]|nr:class I SAM-dependent methyltransferase [Burkholderiales bacterium]MBY0576489.1 class I SAM-dependent methyltransferase [Gallionellaceae bacterium]